MRAIRELTFFTSDLEGAAAFYKRLLVLHESDGD